MGLGRLLGFWGAGVTLTAAMMGKESLWCSARFPGIFQQTLREIFLPDLAQKFSSAIVIAIDFVIRINQTLLKNF